MGEAMHPTVYWTSRTISSNIPPGEKYLLRLLHVLIAPPGCSPEANLLAQYPNVASTEPLFGNHEERPRPIKYVLNQLAALSKPAEDLRLFTFILPYTSGYIVRSDFLRIRLQMLLKSHEVHSFREPLEYCESGELETSSDDLLGMLKTAVGVISLAINQEFDQTNLENQICDRLSYPWLSLQPIVRRRIALVRGRPNYRVGRPVYAAAKALGVSLIIIDEDQHWLQADTPRNEQLREAYLTIDMKESLGLPYRIAAAIKDYSAQVDGIFTLSDNYLVAVAQAAELLGLPTPPSSGYKIAVDKGLTRRLQAAPSEYANVKGEGDLLVLLASGSFLPQYPLIVKPRTRGWNSQYVRKVGNKEELLLAVKEICPKYNDGVVIEPYYGGPEIDVNVVMSEGKVVFQEIVDEAPSCGDLTDESSADFLENGMRAPSLLPLQEQQIIFRSTSEILSGLGLADGVFHVEARISQSSMELRSENGPIDLVSTAPTPSEAVQSHLIEINARPPGLRAQILTQLTYGIDYFAVQILSAVGDKERMKASCHPFNLPQFPQGAQSWSQLVHLPVLSKGTAEGVIAIGKLLHQLPDVIPYVFEYQCCFEPGESLPDPAEYVDVFGHCVVSSNKGRWHVVEIADEILKAYHQNGAESTQSLVHCDQKSATLDSMSFDQNVLDQCVAATTRGNGFHIVQGK